jgi:hypothetical protein
MAWPPHSNSPIRPCFNRSSKEEFESVQSSNRSRIAGIGSRFPPPARHHRNGGSGIRCAASLGDAGDRRHGRTTQKSHGNPPLRGSPSRPRCQSPWRRERASARRGQDPSRCGSTSSRRGPEGPCRRPSQEGPCCRSNPKDPCGNPQSDGRGGEFGRSRETGQAVGSAALLREPLRRRRTRQRCCRQCRADVTVGGPVLVLVEFRAHPRLLGLLPIARSDRTVWCWLRTGAASHRHSEYFRSGARSLVGPRVASAPSVGSDQPAQRLSRPAIGNARRDGGSAHPQAAQRQLLPGPPAATPPSWWKGQSEETLAYYAFRRHWRRIRNPLECLLPRDFKSRCDAVIRKLTGTAIRHGEVISVLKVAVFEAEDLPRLRFRP